jgi:hypothetical protein
MKKRLNSEDKNYRLDFFPFTYGEEIEKKRMEQKELQNEDLKQYLSQTQGSKFN